MTNKSLMILKQILRGCLILACTVFVAIFAVQIMNGRTFGIDAKFISAAYKVRADWLTIIVKIFTNLGSAISIALITLAMVVFVKDWKAKIFAVFNVGFASVLNIIVKHIVKRPRPAVEALIVETGYSFPSGHSMLAMAVFGYLAYLIFKFVKNKYWKWALAILSCIVGVLIALSRVYLGVHYFTDIVCGLILGMAVLVVSIMGHKAMIFLEEWRKKKKSKK